MSQTLERLLQPPRARGAAVLAECVRAFESTQRQLRESLAALTRQAADLRAVNEQLRAEIADRRRAEAQLQALRLALEAALEGISRVDGTGRFVAVNETFARMLGMAASGLERMHWTAVFHPADRRRILTAARRARARGKVECELRALRRGGGTFDCHVTLTRAGLEPGEKGHHCFLRDVSERRQAERDRQRAAAAGARAAALARSNEELQQFARVLAHDLQEPLRSVSGSAKLLLERARRLDGRSRELAGEAVEGARRMSRLICDLLAWARVEAQSRRLFQRLDSEDALLGALANLRAAIEESGAAVSRERLPRVTADHSQLLELFQNLIGNALRFRGGEPPRVHVSSRRRGACWEFCVKDNGLGFAPKESGRLFTLFHRLRRDLPGNGIGLAICKKIVERHGGRIWAASRPGEGAAFYFTLPAGGRRR